RPMENFSTSKRPLYSTTLSKMFSIMWESIRWPSASTTSEKDIEATIVTLRRVRTILFPGRLAVLWIIAAAASAQTRPFAPADLDAWREISDARISADGSRVVYVVSGGDRANLWTVSIDGKARRALTDGPWRDSSPRLSEDGTRLAFLSTRGGS